MAFTAVFAYSRLLLLLRQMAFCSSCKTQALVHAAEVCCFSHPNINTCETAIRERGWLGCGLCIQARADDPESWVASAGQVANTTSRTDFCPLVNDAGAAVPRSMSQKGVETIIGSYSGNMLGSEDRLGNNYIISLSSHPCYKESTGNNSTRCSYAIKAT
jgi:hypothetical protein